MFRRLKVDWVRPKLTLANFSTSHATNHSLSQKTISKIRELHTTNSKNKSDTSDPAKNKFLLPNKPDKLKTVQDIIFFDQNNHTDIIPKPYCNPLQKYGTGVVSSKLSEYGTRIAIEKAAKKGLYYRDPFTLNVIQIDKTTRKLVELQDTSTSLFYYNKTGGSEANFYATKNEFYLQPIDFEASKNSKNLMRLYATFFPKSLENKWFVQGSIIPVKQSMPNAMALKVDRNTNKLMMVRDANKKINPNVYATRMDGQIAAGLAHSHPEKPVNFPDIDTREYGITENYTRRLKEDWHKYDHRWYGGIYRSLILVFIFIVCPSVYRLNNKIGYTLQKCTDDPERRFTDYGYETQSEWYTLSDSKLLSEKDPKEAEVIDSRSEMISAIKLLVNSGLLMNCRNKEEFESLWKKIEPYLSEHVYFSEARPWRKADGIVSGKRYLKYRLEEWWEHNQFHQNLLDPEFKKALNLIQYHPFDLLFEFPVHPRPLAQLGVSSASLS